MNKARLKGKLRTERAAKNRAYAFIIYSRLLPDFRMWQEAQRMNPMQALRDQLTSAALREADPDMLPEEANPDTYRMKYKAARNTMQIYAEEVEAAKKRLRRWDDELNKVCSLYDHLYNIAGNKLTPDEMKRHAEYKRKLNRRS